MRYSVNLHTGEVTISRRSLQEMIRRVRLTKEEAQIEDWNRTHNEDGSIKYYEASH